MHTNALAAAEDHTDRAWLELDTAMDDYRANPTPAGHVPVLELLVDVSMAMRIEQAVRMATLEAPILD